MQCLILCGGLGTRLSKKYKNTPKALIKFNKKENLGLLVENLKKSSVEKFVFLTCHNSNPIKTYVKKKLNVNYNIYDDSHYTGTGGAILNQLKNLEKEFLVILGDLYCDFDFKKFLKFSKKKKSNVCLSVHANSHPHDSDTVEFNSKFQIKKFFLKNSNKPRENNALSGIYYFKKNYFNNYNTNKKHVDLLKDIIVKNPTKIYAYKSLDYVKDYGTVKRIIQIKKDIKKKTLKRSKFGIFVDRDGVLNKEMGPITKLNDFHLIPGVGQSIKKLNKNFIPCFMVSNQASVANGLIDIKTLKLINCKLDNYLAKYSAYLDDILICPNSKTRNFNTKKHSFLWKDRKPNPGMIKELSNRHNIDIKKSYFIGDSDIDILCGKKIKMKTILVKSPRIKKYRFNIKPDFKVNNLTEAIKLIFKNEKIHTS